MQGNPNYVEKLISSLRHPDPVTRVRAAWILGKKRASVAVEPLINALKDNLDDPYILESIVAALGQIGDKKVLSELAVLLKDSYIIVRVQAAKAIGQIGDPDGIEFLTDSLNDPNKAVRQAAAEALKKLAPKKQV